MLTTEGAPPAPASSTSRPLALFVGTWLAYSETFIYDQVRHQSRFRAHVFARRRGSHADAFPYAPVHTLSLLEQARYAFGASRAFARPMAESGAEAVHCHFGVNGVFALPFVGDRPLVVTFHGHDVAGLLPQNKGSLRYWYYRRRAPQMFERAARLLCCSSELAELLHSVGAPSSKLVVHRLGVDLTRFTFVDRPDRAPTALMIGRMVEKKGMNYGIEAFAQVQATLPDARLSIVGDGPLRPQLTQMAEALGVANAIDWLGVLDAQGVRAALARADVLMTPSVVGRRGDRESGVIVLKEAGATGLPTVGTQHGGIPEIIENEATGFLVPERDVHALADRLRLLMADHALRQQMGAAARAKIEAEYDTVRQNQRLEDHLADVL